jgi:hypothetical protein
VPVLVLCVARTFAARGPRANEQKDRIGGDYIDSGAAGHPAAIALYEKSVVNS